MDESALEVRLSDLSTFLAVVRFGSINGAARSLQVSPSQVSKAVERLERRLGMNLLTRGRRGVTASAAGKRAVPRFEAMLGELDALHNSEAAPQAQLTLAATSFLNCTFIPVIAAAFPRYRVRSLELPPGVASAYAAERLFDAALTTENEVWPRSWMKTPIGQLRRAVFAAPQVAEKLGRGPVSPSDLASFPFICPIYSYHGQIVPGDDGCPLGPRERRIGHQTQTLSLALEIATKSEQVVFAPELFARRYTVDGKLVEIPVQGWDVRDSLSVVCDEERLRAPVLRELVSALRKHVAS